VAASSSFWVQFHCAGRRILWAGTALFVPASFRRCMCSTVGAIRSAVCPHASAAAPDNLSREVIISQSTVHISALPLPVALLRTCRTDLCLYQQMQQPLLADVHTVLGAVGGKRCLRALAEMAIAALSDASPLRIAALLKPLPPDYLHEGGVPVITLAGTSTPPASAALVRGSVLTELLRTDLESLLATPAGVIDAMPNNAHRRRPVRCCWRTARTPGPSSVVAPSCASPCCPCHAASRSGAARAPVSCARAGPWTQA
jgi:hypothetical protein